MVRRTLRRLRYIFRQQRFEAELAEELRFHRELTQQELQARGVSADEARWATGRAFGNDALASNQARDVWVPPPLQDIGQDVRFAVRMLAKDRRFTIAAVVALGLGIGVNNSVFAIINATLIGDVPFERGDRLLGVRTIDSRGQEIGVSLLDFRDLQQSNRTFEGMAAETGGTMNVSDQGLAPERFRGAYVSNNCFRLLRLTPILGRDFLPDDDRRGAASVVIIGHGVWIDRYGSDPAIIGRTVKIDNVPTTIVGVMPPGFRFPFIAQMWQPLAQAPSLITTDPRRDVRNLGVTARLADSTTRTQAQADLDTIAARLAADHPSTNKAVRVRLAGMKEAVERNSRSMLATMMGAVGFVMLIACANLASLLLARSASRAREIAIRASLGATRWRITRQLLIECAILAVLAGALGIWLSYYGMREIAVAFSPLEVGASLSIASTPYWLDLSMNGYVYAFVGVLCLLATLAFGLLPALHISKIRPHDALKEGGRTTFGVRARQWSTVLMTGELALTLVLLTGAGLLWRSFVTLYQVDPVLDPSDVVTMEFALPVRQYATPDQRRQVFQQLEDRLSGIPMVRSITVASHQPGGGMARQVTTDGSGPAPGDKAPTAISTYVGPRYFETLVLPTRWGRTLVEADSRPGQEGAVVDERFADMFFPEGDAIGRRIQLTSTTPPSTTPWLTVVGIVPTLPRSLGPGPRGPDPAVYVPLRLDPSPRVASIIVRAPPGGVSTVAPLLRHEVRAVDPDLPLYNIARLEDAMALSRYPVRLVGTWFGILAVFALIVASVGLFALTAHGVAQRTQEIGVRIALGAQAWQVMWMFMRRTLLQLVIGLALGLAGALSIGQLLRAYLRDLSSRDPVTIALVVVLLTCVTAIATLLPARRAARIDPAVALRAE